MGILKVESYKKGIVLSTVFNVFNKGLVFLNGIVVAYYFGLKDATDIFFYSYNSIILLGVFIASMNSSVLIPESMRIRTEKGEASAIAFLNFFIALYFLLLLLSVCLILINPVSFFSTVSNFNNEHLKKNEVLLYLALPLFCLIGIITLFIDILSSYKFFTISMIIGIINGITSILFVLIFHNILEIKSVFIGLILSYTFNLVLLGFLMKRFLNWKFVWSKIRIEKRIWKNMGFAQLGNVTSIISSYMPMYILSGFSTGIITSFTFAQQISGLPIALIITQFSSVAGIKFNELYAKRLTTDINKVFFDSGDFLLFLMVPTGFFTYLFSGEIVMIVLGHRVLGDDGIYFASFFLKYLGLLLPMYVINTLFGRLFMATHKVKEGVWYQIIFNAILLSGMYISVKRIGIIGYPLSMLIAHSLNILGCYFIGKNYFDFIDYWRMLRRLAIIILINLVIAGIVYFLMDNLKLLNSFLTICTGFSIYAGLLLLANKIFSLNKQVTDQLEGVYKKLLQYGNSGSKQ